MMQMQFISLRGCIGREMIKVSWIGPTITDEDDDKDSEEEEILLRVIMRIV